MTVRTTPPRIEALRRADAWAAAGEADAGSCIPVLTPMVPLALKREFGPAMVEGGQFVRDVCFCVGDFGGGPAGLQADTLFTGYSAGECHQ